MRGLMSYSEINQKSQDYYDEKGRSVVTAQVPLAEMQRYTTDLRSITGGRGVFSMEFSRYERVPAHIAQEVIETRQKEIAAAREE